MLLFGFVWHTLVLRLVVMVALDGAVVEAALSRRLLREHTLNIELAPG